MYLDAAQSPLTDGSFHISPGGRSNIFAPLPPPYNNQKLGRMYDTDAGHLFVRPNGQAYELLTNGPSDWVEVELGLGFFKKAWGYVKRGARWVTRQVKRGYDYVVKKVKDFDKWMRENVGDAYSFVSDVVIEVGREAKLFIAEAANGFIEACIVAAGVFVGSLIAGLCAAGISAGIPIPPVACTALAIAAAAATRQALKNLKDEMVDEWNKPAYSVNGDLVSPEPPASSPNANPLNNGVQALAMGVAAATCGMPPGLPQQDAPPGTLVTYLGREPNPGADPCVRARHWEAWLQQSQFDPEQSKDREYYTCRRNTAQFECDKARMEMMGVITGNMTVKNIIGMKKYDENISRSLAELTPESLIRTVSANMLFKEPIKEIVKVDPEKETAKAVVQAQKTRKSIANLNAEESDNTYMYLALAIVGGGALYYAKKKGMF